MRQITLNTTPKSDHLGSSSWITTATGNANQRLAYLPYGEQFIDERKADDSRDIRFKFTGKERDPEIKPLDADSPNTTENKLFMRQTGLDYFGARYYSSGLSVWLSVDALAGKYPNESPYCYAGLNPVMITDPNGMWKGEVDKDGNVKYIAEKGDNKKTFRDQYDLSKKEAQAIFNSKDSKLNYDKETGNLIEGSFVTGKAVKKTTGSDILKLDLMSNMATDQRIFEHYLFAINHSKSQGKFGFYSNTYFGHVFSHISRYHEGFAKKGGIKIHYKLPLFQSQGILIGVTLYPYFIGNTSVTDKYTYGTMFSSKPDKIYNLDFPTYLNFGFGLKRQMYGYRLMTPESNKDKLNAIFNF